MTSTSTSRHSWSQSQLLHRFAALQITIQKSPLLKTTVCSAAGQATGGSLSPCRRSNWPVYWQLQEELPTGE